MSIRLKLYLGCLALTIVTVVLGGVALHSQRQIGALTATIYDEAFIAMNYLRSAQNTLLAADGRFGAAIDGAAATPVEERAARRTLIAALPLVQEDLAIAAKRALSPEGRLKTQRIRDWLKELAAFDRHLDRGQVIHLLRRTGAELDTAVEIFAGDGYRFRRQVDELIASSRSQTLSAIALSVAIGLVITHLLQRAILPSLSHAVRLARAISDGKLDNRIEAKGRSEAAVLLNALSKMQDSIAGHIRRIEELRKAQVSSYAGQLHIQHARFDAALNNMTQGLCLFDGGGRLAVFNRRFADLFGTPGAGVDLAGLNVERALADRLAENPQDSFVHELADGRIVEVSKEPVEDGGWVATFEDVTERSRAEAKLAHMARHDALTELPNRAFFREHLGALLRAGSETRWPAVLCLDLDGFKNVNDTFGHPCGDLLLRQVGERLRSCLGEDDMLARIGGDEFAVVHLVSEDDFRRIDRLAAAIIGTLARPFDIAGQSVSIGVSIGIGLSRAAAGAGEAEEVEILLKNSDIALYRAKSEGRSTYRFFEAEMDERIQSRRRIELDLRSAIEGEEIEVFYQPFVNVELNALSGLEALVRWRHPERGLISPAEFIPVAEEVGLIDRIGRIVLEKACAQAAGWPGDLPVAVNLSPAQFRDPHLVRHVAETLEASGLEPYRLQLEVTESLLLQDTPGVLATLAGLRALGVRISMDDFGTGYSSLSYLRKFPFDKIKIDQSFVRGIAERDNLAIVRAVLGLGRAMDIAVIAEGVETAQQAAILKAEGCSELQGYYFSRPRPASDLPKLLVELADRLAEAGTAQGWREAGSRLPPSG